MTLLDTRECIIKQGIFDRWYILNAYDDELGWTGSSWASCSPDGYPTGMYQICNFESEQEAREFCAERGLSPKTG